MKPRVKYGKRDRKIISCTSIECNSASNLVRELGEGSPEEVTLELESEG